MGSSYTNTLTALQSGEVALPLSEHLLPSTRDKILRGKFIDLFNLLYREIEKKDKEELDDKEKEKLQKCKVDRTWANWLLGFFIYAGVISRAQPWRETSLWQYLDIIYKGFSSFSGPA